MSRPQPDATALAFDLGRALDPVSVMVDAGLAPDPWQTELMQSEAERIVLLAARQTGKSTTCAALALHSAIYDPGPVLIVAPSLRQSGEMMRKVKDIHPRLKVRPAIAQESGLRLELANGSRIIALPGAEATLRGYSAVKLILIDEAARVSDELFAAVRPMLATTKGRMILLSTPYGRRGFFFEAWNAGVGFERIKITAAQCPRISPEWLDEERRVIGEWQYKQEYCCEFMDTQEQLFSSAIIDAAMSREVRPLWES